jgi:hypothetical protein
LESAHGAQSAALFSEFLLATIGFHKLYDR